MKRNKLFISLVLTQLFFLNHSFSQVNSKSQLPINLQNGLVAFYPFNGNAGDSSGNGNHGTIFGAINTSDRNNQINSAYSFDGSSNYIAASPSISNSSLINNASFSCWLYSFNYDNYIVCKSNSTIGDYRIFTSSSFARLVINGKEYSVEYNFPLNRWFHFVVTFSNGLFKLYINGSFIGSTNNLFTTYPERNTSTNFEIGRDPWGLSEYHYGKIDDLLIYDRELSSNEITQLYSGAICQPGQGITINPLQDTTRVCGTSTQLNAGSGFSSYAWNTGAKTQSISPTQSGFYKVTVTNNNGCSASDSTYLSLVKAKIIQRDTTICKGASLKLNLADLFQNNFELIGILNNKYYYLSKVRASWDSAKNDCFMNGGYLASINSKAENDYIASIAKDYFWIGLWQNHSNVNFSEPGGGWEWISGEPLTFTMWAPPSEPNNIFPNEDFGVFYWNTPGYWNDDASSEVRPTNLKYLLERSSLISSERIKWSTGDTSTSITVNPSQTTKYYVTVSDGITSCRDSITVTVNDPNGFNPLSDTVRVCGDSVVLDAGVGLSSYLWNTGATTRSIIAKSAGKFNVSVRNAAGCISTDSTYLSLVKAKIIQRDTTICKGSSLNIGLNSNSPIIDQWTRVSMQTDFYTRILRTNNGKYLAGAQTNSRLYLSDSLFNFIPFSSGLASHNLSMGKDRLGNIYYGTGHQGIFKSNDNGMSWVYNVAGGYGCGNLDFETDNQNNLYTAVGGYLRGLYVSKDAGVSWQNTFYGIDFTDIEFLSGYDKVFITSGGKIWYSSSQGSVWIPINDKPFSSNTIMVKSFAGKIFVFSNNGEVYSSNDGGNNWILFSTMPIVSSPSTYLNDAIFVNEKNIYVSLDQNGIFHSVDNGITWKLLSNGISGNPHYLYFEKNILLATTSNGIYKLNVFDGSTKINWSTRDTTKSITVAPTQTTKYYVTVSDGITSCRDSVTVTVATLDTSITMLDPPVVCAQGGAARMLAGFASSYKWYRNDTLIAGANTRLFTATKAGIYKVVVANAQGCSDTSRSIQIVEEPRAKAGSISGPQVVCSPVNKSILKLSGYLGNIQWQFSSDSISYSNLGGEVKDSLVLLNLKTKVFFRAIVKSSVCSSDTSAAVSIRYIQQSPAFDLPSSAQCFDNNKFVFTNASTASEGTLSYKWDFGDSTYSLAVSPSMSYRRDGTYKVVLTVNNSFGCSDTVSKVIQVFATPSRSSIVLTGKQNICVGDSVLLTGGNFATYRWYRNDVELKGDTSKTYKPLSSGMYSLRGVSKDGCFGEFSDKISLVINPLPSTPIVKDSIYCFGSVAKPLGASISKGHSSLWYKQVTGDTASSTATIPMITALGKTDFYVSQRNDTTGCESPRAKISITVASLPKKPSIKFDGGIFLVDTGHVSYQWIADGKLVSTSSVYFYKPVITGVYKVKVTNASGCSDTSLAYNLVVTAVNNMGTNAGIKMLKVYPNPSKSRVWVDIGERPLKGAYIKVLDSRGSEVRKIFITQQTTVIEWSGLVSGAYMLEVVNGTSRKTTRVVKE